MRISRLTAGLVTAGLLGVTPLAITAPANAATLTSATTLTVSASFSPDGVFDIGDSLSFSGAVTGSDTKTPNSTDGGTASLQILSAAIPTWTTIATDTSASSLFFSDIDATTNASYKVVYSGGISGFGSTANTLTPSESAPVSVSVARKIAPKTKDLTVFGKVTPDFGKKKIKVLKKVGKKYKKFKTIKTNKKGKFTFKAPRKNKFKFALVIPGDALYAPVTKFYIVRIF